jgi:hypothetical protein
VITIDFNLKLERWFEQHVISSYGFEFCGGGNRGEQLHDVGLNRPDYPLNGGSTNLLNINTCLVRRNKALTGETDIDLQGDRSA